MDRVEQSTILRNFTTPVTSHSTILGFIQVFLQTGSLIGRYNFVSAHKILTHLHMSFPYKDLHVIKIKSSKMPQQPISA